MAPNEQLNSIQKEKEKGAAEFGGILAKYST